MSCELKSLHCLRGIVAKPLACTANQAASAVLLVGYVSTQLIKLKILYKVTEVQTVTCKDQT